MPSSRVPRRPILLAAGLGLPAAALARCGLGDAPSSDAHEPEGEREVTLVAPAVATSDGAGVKLHRALGANALPLLDPFLLLDEMHSDQPADYARGFPTHPHRGFETVTYVLEGAADHQDSLGNHGHLGAGSAQWMTAGRGIVHSEMPTHDAGSTRLWALQLWVNLPAARKMGPPRYQDIAASRIPDVRVDDALVRLVAGEVGGVRGPVSGIATDPEMLDVALPPGGSFTRPIARSRNAFAYVLDGAIALGASRRLVRQGEIAVLGAGTHVSARSLGGGRFLLLHAAPIGEPVARSGPFVMNTDAELRQAWDDYRSGRLVTGA